MKDLIYKTYKLSVFRYLVTGGTAFAIEYGSFLFLFYILNFGSELSNSVSFGTGLITSFCLNKLWTFKGGKYTHTSRRQLVIYMLVAITNLIFTNLSINILIHYNVPGYVAKVVLVALVACWNYIIFKKLIFKNQ